MLEFERKPGETEKAFAAFRIYLGLGAQRSVRVVSQHLGKSPCTIEKWATKWGWSRRVAEHGAHLAKLEREATSELARDKAALWVQRQEEQRDLEWALRNELVDAGRKVLKRFTEEGKGATLGDVARALELATKLGRLSSGMATEKTEVTGQDGGPVQVELSVELKAALDRVYGPVIDVAPEPPTG